MAGRQQKANQGRNVPADPDSTEGERRYHELVDLLRDREYKVRLQAVGDMLRLGDARAGEALSRRVTDRSLRVRAAIAGALGEIADARGVRALVRFHGDSSPKVVQAAQAALARLPGPEADRQFALALIDASRRPRIDTARAYANLDHRRALLALGQFARTGRKRDRHRAAHVLASLNDPGAVALLMEFLGDADSGVRRAGARALGEMGAVAGAALKPLREKRVRTSMAVLEWWDLANAIRRIEDALRKAPAEMESAPAPAGRGTEMEAASAPAGRGTELSAGPSEEDEPEEDEEEEPVRPWWAFWRR